MGQVFGLPRGTGLQEEIERTWMVRWSARRSNTFLVVSGLVAVGLGQRALGGPASVCQFQELVIVYSAGEWEELRLWMLWAWRGGIGDGLQGLKAYTPETDASAEPVFPSCLSLMLPCSINDRCRDSHL